jgi:hypothetical protein
MPTATVFPCRCCGGAGGCCLDCDVLPASYTIEVSGVATKPGTTLPGCCGLLNGSFDAALTTESDCVQGQVQAPRWDNGDEPTCEGLTFSRSWSVAANCWADCGVDPAGNGITGFGEFWTVGVFLYIHAARRLWCNGSATCAGASMSAYNNPDSTACDYSGATVTWFPT